MEAKSRGINAFAGARTAALVLALLAPLGLLALAGGPARAGEYDTVGADDRCLEGRDDFRDLDGNGCPEPLVEAGELSARFSATGSGRKLRVRVTSLNLIADRDSRVTASCRPKCGGDVRRLGGRRVEVAIQRTFRYGELIGVRVWRDGHVGRFFGYRIKKRRLRYVACLLRTPKGDPKRCHT